jgi:hypothetical protein
MQSATPVLIEAIVDERERPALIAASEQLGKCLGFASAGAVQTRIAIRETIAHIDLCGRPSIVVASLLPEVERTDEPIALTQARWQSDLSALRGRGAEPVFVCTVFRWIARTSNPDQPDARLWTMERIRRLNLLAAELSHDLGVSIIDIDRVFAHFGARTLETDYRLVGAAATEIAAHVIASTILAVGFGDVIPAEVQERARKLQGGMREIAGLVTYRLSQRR